jgi:hypothetical protein
MTINHTLNPLRAAAGLTDAALHQYGVEHLRRGGALGRALAEVRRGAPPDSAASTAAVFGKGLVAEVRLAAEQTIDAGLRDLPYFTQPNSVANHPHADLLVRDAGRVAQTVQVGVGGLDYLKAKAKASKAGAVVVPSVVKAALCEDAHPACQRVIDRVTYRGTSSGGLDAEAATEDAKVILLRAMSADSRVGELAKMSIAATGGIGAAMDSFGTSLLFEAVDRLWNNEPFNWSMVERAVVSAGRAGVRSALQTYVAVDDFLRHARSAFNARMVQRVARGLVWTGAVADVVVSTAVEVWRWLKSEISFEELLRRFGVHAIAAAGGSVGAAVGLYLTVGAPAWVTLVGVLGLGFLGWRVGKALGDELFRPQWAPAQQG